MNRKAMTESCEGKGNLCYEAGKSATCLPTHSAPEHPKTLRGKNSSPGRGRDNRGAALPQTRSPGHAPRHGASSRAQDAWRANTTHTHSEGGDGSGAMPARHTHAAQAGTGSASIHSLFRSRLRKELHDYTSNNKKWKNSAVPLLPPAYLPAQVV
jgi:hypothetical protein